MILLLDQSKLSVIKGRNTPIPIKCLRCGITFYAPKYRVLVTLKGSSVKSRGQLQYCGTRCSHLASKRARLVKCTNCGKQIEKFLSAITPNNFCSRSCSCIYHNKNKTTGFRRSKGEIYLINKIKNDFPMIKILENSRNFLPSGLEIDILIIKNKIAIEVNGPIHYKPIFGNEKLYKTKLNDNIKQKELINLGFLPIIIDTSKYIHINRLKPYLDDYYKKILKPLIFKRPNQCRTVVS